MAEFTVPVVQIVSISPIENADAIEVAQVLDYRCVVKKGEYQVGDLAVYIPEAAIVPENILADMGLTGKLAGPQGNRVKAIKLRGVVSQGLLLPLTFLVGTEAYGQSPGYDVSSVLGITKYEPPVPTHLAGEVKNLFGYTLKYDIENIQKYPNILYTGEEVVMTEKLHGCVHPDTLIMLPNGEELPISEVINNNKITQVLSYDVATKQFMTKNITAKLRRPNIEKKKWVRLILENGRKLRITEDHPVFSNDRNEYIEAKNILPNEDIKSPI